MAVGAVLDQLAVLDDSDLGAGEAVLNGDVHEVVDHVQSAGIHADILRSTLDNDGVTGANGDDLVLAHRGNIGDLDGVDAVNSDVSNVDLVGLACGHALGLDLNIVDEQTEGLDGSVQGDVDLALVTVTVPAAQAVDSQGIVGTVGECTVHLPILSRQSHLGDTVVTGGGGAGASCKTGGRNGENHHDGQQQSQQLARCLFHCVCSLLIIICRYNGILCKDYSKIDKCKQALSPQLVHYSHTRHKFWVFLPTERNLFHKRSNCLFIMYKLKKHPAKYRRVLVMFQLGALRFIRCRCRACGCGSG